MRLPVDAATGERVQDHRVNILTVSASESYERFVTGLQGEIEKEYGKDGVPPNPGNARAKVDLKLRKNYLLRPEFQELWNKIKHRTRYAVTIDSAKLVADVVVDTGSIKVRRPRVVVQVAGVNAKKGEDLFEAIRFSDASVAIDLEGRYPVPNIVSIVENLMEATSPPMRLGRKTILSILKSAPDPKAMLDNPHEFASALTGIIKTRLAEQLVAGIKYQRDGSWYEQTQFDALIEAFEANVVKSEANGPAGDASLRRRGSQFRDNRTSLRRTIREGRPRKALRQASQVVFGPDADRRIQSGLGHRHGHRRGPRPALSSSRNEGFERS